MLQVQQLIAAGLGATLADQAGEDKVVLRPLVPEDAIALGQLLAEEGADFCIIVSARDLQRILSSK